MSRSAVSEGLLCRNGGQANEAFWCLSDPALQRHPPLSEMADHSTGATVDFRLCRPFIRIVVMS
jgi:hypothetical protein